MNLLENLFQVPHNYHTKQQNNSKLLQAERQSLTKKVKNNLEVTIEKKGKCASNK